MNDPDRADKPNQPLFFSKRTKAACQQECGDWQQDGANQVEDGSFVNCQAEQDDTTG